MHAFNIDNIIAGNGIAISITGMAIVFCGLILISFSISLLPRVITFFEKLSAKPVESEPNQESTPVATNTATQPSIDPQESDIAGIIGLVLQLEEQQKQVAGQLQMAAIPN